MSKTFSSEPWLRLHFLGGCEMSLPDGPVQLETVKTRALLVYLTSNPTPQSRHTLMGLLWAELPEANARGNLRRALWNLRRQLASPELPSPILADRERVCLNREMDYWSDVEAFEKLCSQLDPASPTPNVSLERDHTDQVVELYRGDFLGGFFVGNANGFEEWVFTERERLHVKAVITLRRLAQDILL